MNVWLLVALLLLAGIAIAVALGRGWVPRGYRPLATFLLLIVALGTALGLNEGWSERRAVRDERGAVVAVIREMRGEIAQYRQMLARVLPRAEPGQVVVNRQALRADLQEMPMGMLARMQGSPLVLKHFSSMTYNRIGALLDRMSAAQELLADGDDERVSAAVMGLQRDVELVDKILSWESLYQQGVFSPTEMTAYMKQLDQSHRPTS